MTGINEDNVVLRRVCWPILDTGSRSNPCGMNDNGGGRRDRCGHDRPILPFDDRGLSSRHLLGVIMCLRCCPERAADKDQKKDSNNRSTDDRLLQEGLAQEGLAQERLAQERLAQAPLTVPPPHGAHTR